jgi:ring-1,2-phenylacetyl-CoA epoxidase subunit PaaB
MANGCAKPSRPTLRDRPRPNAKPANIPSEQSVTDTQWPRFEVFEQERAGQPHRNTGAVHAPDPELALQNARDVFVRRPECTSLWVAPASQIYSWTAQQLAGDDDWQSETLLLARRAEPWEVFLKQTHRQSGTFVTYAGQVEARSPAEALRLAMAQYGGHGAYVWWLVPARAVVRSAADEADSLFGAARDKPYRQPNFYHVLTQMRDFKLSDPDAAPDGRPGDSSAVGT